jgi:hypothetical protein
VTDPHLSEGGWHDIDRVSRDDDERVLIGFDGGADGLTFVQLLDGGEFVHLGYISADGLTYHRDEPADPATITRWNNAVAGGKTTATRGWDKSPEGTRRHFEKWWTQDWPHLDMDAFLASLEAEEARRVAQWRLREHLNRARRPKDRTFSDYWFWRGANVQDGHEVIDGEVVEGEAFAWRPAPVDRPTLVARWEDTHRHADDVPVEVQRWQDEGGP